MVLADAHGELELLLQDLTGIEARLRGQHAIKRGHAEASAGAELKDEFLWLRLLGSSSWLRPRAKECPGPGGRRNFA